jgi:hypothetical protein
MAPQAALGVSVLFSFLAWGTVSVTYIWPTVRSMPRPLAMRALLTLHAFRFVGLAFLVPGVVAPELPPAFARPDAYGDLGAAFLALLTLWLLPRAGWIPLAWLANLWGVLDLLNAIYRGNTIGLALEPGQLGATFFIITFAVPLLLITHVLMFALLLRPERETQPARRHCGTPGDLRSPSLRQETVAREAQS